MNMKIHLLGTEISEPQFGCFRNVKHREVNIYVYDNVMTIYYEDGNELKLATVMLSDYHVIIDED